MVCGVWHLLVVLGVVVMVTEVLVIGLIVWALIVLYPILCLMGLVVGLMVWGE